MDSSIFRSEALVAAPLCPASASFSTLLHRLPCVLSSPCPRLPCLITSVSRPMYPYDRSGHLRKFCSASGSGILKTNSVPVFDPLGQASASDPLENLSHRQHFTRHLAKNGVYTVGEFMTRKEDLHVVRTNTTVDEALETLVEKRITGFPVIDDDWKLVGVVSDYDLLALDSISGSGRTDTSMFPEVDSTWKTFNALQKLLSKTNGKVIGDVMTPAPLVVRETTNLEDAARLLLETKYRRLPVVDSDGKLIGLITRGNVVRAALQIKHDCERTE